MKRHDQNVQNRANEWHSLCTQVNWKGGDTGLKSGEKRMLPVPSRLSVWTRKDGGTSLSNGWFFLWKGITSSVVGERKLYGDRAAALTVFFSEIFDSDVPRQVKRRPRRKTGNSEVCCFERDLGLSLERRRQSVIGSIRCYIASAINEKLRQGAGVWRVSFWNEIFMLVFVSLHLCSKTFFDN